MEPLEDPLPFARRNSGAVIRDPDKRMRPVAGHADRYLGRPSRVRKAVVDQIVEDATELACICLHGNRISGQARGNLGTKQLDPWQSTFPGILDNPLEVNPAQVV